MCGAILLYVSDPDLCRLPLTERVTPTQERDRWRDRRGTLIDEIGYRDEQPWITTCSFYKRKDDSPENRPNIIIWWFRMGGVSRVAPLPT